MLWRIGSLVLVLFLAEAVLAAEVSLEARLRESGVEPNAKGVREYLETHLLADPGKKIDELIADLGSQAFGVRESATQSLRRAPQTPRALEKLKAAAESDEPERSFRAKLILKSRETPREPQLLWALQLVEEKKLEVGLPLLLKVREAAPTAAEQEAAVRAALAIAGESDRETVATMVKAEDQATRNIGRRLLARLDRAAVPLLEGSFDAVFVKPGGVAGGGPDLIEGWEFKSRNNVTVTHLGVFDRDANGLTEAHEVAIWDIEKPARPVTSGTVPAGDKAPLKGEFRFVPVEPAVLESGRRYAIVAHYPTPDDGNVSLINPSGLTIEFAAHLDVAGRRYSFPHKAMAFPDLLAAELNQASLGPSMRDEVDKAGLKKRP